MAFPKLIQDAANCTICKEYLVDGVRPVFRIHPHARINIIGQTPGRRVHESGIPWADASGKRLRTWLGVTDEEFYDTSLFAIMPMGFPSTISPACHTRRSSFFVGKQIKVGVEIARNGFTNS